MREELASDVLSYTVKLGPIVASSSAISAIALERCALTMNKREDVPSWRRVIGIAWSPEIALPSAEAAVDATSLRARSAAGLPS